MRSGGKEMFRRVAPYIGEYRKYTAAAAVLMWLGIVANVIPDFLLYQIISPLTRGEHIDLPFVMLRVLAVAVCEILFALFYVKGLEFSHISAYNTLKNLRISLQGKLENSRWAISGTWEAVASKSFSRMTSIRSSCFWLTPYRKGSQISLSRSSS